MKKYIILFFIFSIAVSWSEEYQDIVELKQGEKAPYSGVLLPADEYKKMYEAYTLVDKYTELETNLKSQIAGYTAFIDLKNQEIALLQKKYDFELKLREDYQKRYEGSEFKIKGLTITTSIGLSISLAELIGVGVFALMYNSMVR